MALTKKIRNLTSEENTGFGSSSSNSGGRFYNRNSGSNVFKKGVNIFNRYSWYHTMLAMSRAKFIILIFSIYILVNFVFAGIYYIIGIEHLSGVNAGSTMKNFSEVFFLAPKPLLP